jgi:hypothetical protein
MTQYEIVFTASYSIDVDAEGQGDAKDKAMNELLERDPDTGDLGMLEIATVLQ